MRYAGANVAIKLWSAIVVLLIVMLTIGGWTLIRAQSIDRSATESIVRAHQRIEQANLWKGLTDSSVTRKMAVAISSDDTVGSLFDAKRMAEESKQVAQVRTALAESAETAAEKDLMIEIGAKAKALIAASDEASRLRSTGEMAAVAKLVKGDFMAATADYLAAIDRFAALQVHQADQAATDAEQRRAGVLVLGATGAVFVFATGLVVAIVLVRSIRTPLKASIDVARAIAHGDLACSVPTDRSDEFGELMRALQSMRQSLNGMVGDVRDSASSIGLASTEIAIGNQDLSRRTEQTSARLQQTASSMNQLTSTVQHSAQAAAQANHLASSAASAASRGGEVVSQVVRTMDDIDASSKRIADIIGTIDGIAFQTNILALNAAVEAARAGEQGRGFAVVAGEVRSLAQRSAEAAREIKSLIGNSVDKVAAGALLVRDAGRTMNEIVASVQRVCDTIRDITTASSEQSSGIGHVNRAVAELDQMTQENAALVEQSAAAAESLSDQTKRLTSGVSMFRLAAN